MIQYIKSKSASQLYYMSVFEIKFDWKNICIIITIVAVDITAQIFQYEIFSSIVYMNKLLFKSKKACNIAALFVNQRKKQSHSYFPNQLKHKPFCSSCIHLATIIFLTSFYTTKSLLWIYRYKQRTRIINPQTMHSFLKFLKKAQVILQ